MTTERGVLLRSLVPGKSPGRFGDYLLLERMATGGMGEVFVARRVAEFRRLCCVKRMLPELGADEEFSARFRDEARLALEMRHPNVVRVLEVGAVDRQRFMAMELVNGRDLGKLLGRAWRRQRAVPIPAAVYIVCKVLRALEYCHRVTDELGQSIDLVHRDISPANVMVSFDGEVKVIDFGLAISRLRAVQTQPKVVMGKPGYIAPERLAGGPVDQRTDLFNVGVLLFELLTCERHTLSCDPESLLQELQQHGGRVASSVRPAVPEDLDQLLRRALAFDRESRLSSATEFRRALERILRRVGACYGPRQLGELMRHVFDAEAAGEKLRTLLERSLPARGRRQRYFGFEDTVPTVIEQTGAQAGRGTTGPQRRCFGPVGSDRFVTSLT